MKRIGLDCCDHALPSASSEAQAKPPAPPAEPTFMLLDDSREVGRRLLAALFIMAACGFLVWLLRQ